MTLSPTEKLLAIEEIKNLKARYFRFLDSHDWAGYRSLLTDDAEFALPIPPHPDFAKDVFHVGDDIKGGDAIVAWVSMRLESVKSTHLGYMPEIEIISAHEARGLWGMEDILRAPSRTIHGYGYYREHYVCTDGVWRIKRYELYYKAMNIMDAGATGSRIV